MEILQTKLIRLQSDANEACRRAIEAKNEIGGAVNWADLCCVDAMKVVNVDGEEWFIVNIEEASPSEHKLYLFISDELRALGWENVEVRLEW